MEQKDLTLAQLRGIYANTQEAYQALKITGDEWADVIEGVLDPAMAAAAGKSESDSVPTEAPGTVINTLAFLTDTVAQPFETLTSGFFGMFILGPMMHLTQEGATHVMRGQLIER
jgi:hypothetical protein